MDRFDQIAYSGLLGEIYGLFISPGKLQLYYLNEISSVWFFVCEQPIDFIVDSILAVSSPDDLLFILDIVLEDNEFVSKLVYRFDTGSKSLEIWKDSDIPCNGTLLFVPEDLFE